MPHDAEAYILLRCYAHSYLEKSGRTYQPFFMSLPEFRDSSIYNTFVGLARWMHERNLSPATKMGQAYVEFAFQHVASWVGIPAPYHLSNEIAFEHFCEAVNSATCEPPPDKRTDAELRELYKNCFDPSMCTEEAFRNIGL